MAEKNTEQSMIPRPEAAPGIPFVFLTRGKSYRESMKKLFPNMSAADFLLMWLVAGKIQVTGGEKVYLVDIAETLQLPIHRVSNIVKELKAKGLVIWKHDGDGDKGTYIQLTEASLDVVREQHKILKSFYQDVIAQYGEENFIRLMRELSDLEEIITNTLQDEEDKPDE
ncbi:MAG: MarR family winged helix-turn-helix transcriptional regulator [Oscillospiraceae bacterium]|nr:MarR family winged helix-turn-helix transcriptional regulator [Oscillospiraceae bacterium]